MSAFLTFTLLYILLVIAPGPDLLMVTKNAVLYNKRLAIYTALGIACGFLIHLSYSLLGLALIISQSVLLFTIIKFCGAMYLIYSGYTTLVNRPQPIREFSEDSSLKTFQIPRSHAFRQGFFCNVLNPKVTLFFLSLSSIIVAPLSESSTPVLPILCACEAFLITLGWFSLIATLISTQQFKHWFEKIHNPFLNTIGVLFILLGLGLVLLKIE
jgi:threonine/homoserine/homoserine lactone efflux protein